MQQWRCNGSNENELDSIPINARNIYCFESSWKPSCLQADWLTKSIVSHVKKVLLPVSAIAVLRLGQQFPSSDLSLSAIEFVSKEERYYTEELMINIAKTNVTLQKTFLQIVSRHRRLEQVSSRRFKT